MPYVTVKMLEGRTDEQKRNLVEKVTEAVKETTGASEEKIVVFIEEMRKEHVLIFARLIRPLKYSSKLSVLPFLLRACSAYFSTALRRKEWLFAAACSAPYLVIRALDLSRRVGRRLCIRHKV